MGHWEYGIIVEFRTLSNEHGGRNGVESRVILADGERLVVVWSFVALHQSLLRFVSYSIIKKSAPSLKKNENTLYFVLVRLSVVHPAFHRHMSLIVSLQNRRATFLVKEV